MSACCRISAEAILSVVRNRSGMWAGEIDYIISCNKMERLTDQELDDCINMLGELAVRCRVKKAELIGLGWNYVENKPSETAETIYSSVQNKAREVRA